MTRRLVYVSGEPGVGKSTTMRHLTDGLTRYPQPPEPLAPARDLLTAPRLGVVAVELGRRREWFAGTDALPSAVIGAAVAYVRAAALGEANLVLAEGARLANRRFLTEAVAAGWQVTLVHLFGSAVAAHRRRHRATALGRREQDERWIRGRQTAARNLANAADGWGVTVLPVDAAHPGVVDTVRAAVPELAAWAPA